VDAYGYPVPGKTEFDFWNAPAVDILLGGINPIAAGLKGAAGAIVKDDPVQLALSLLGGAAKIGSPVSALLGLGRGASALGINPLEDIGEDLSFGDLDTESLLAALDYGGPATSDSIDRNGPSREELPYTVPETGSTLETLAELYSPSNFAMLGEPLAQSGLSKYAGRGRRFFDEGDIVDIGGQYGLA
ncbi:MAG: hypothetical protein KAJ19_26760, partial [Gammaproteobacteria bacterium]|nr:hypothetical protein [Gammaproteobacteria bacterium]